MYVRFSVCRGVLSVWFDVVDIRDEIWLLFNSILELVFIVGFFGVVLF